MSQSMDTSGLGQRYEEDSDDECEDVDADNELDLLWLERSKSDLPIEYFQIQKLLKYAKNGNVTVTVLTLSVLSDFHLDSEVCQRAILEEDGVELLLNILDTKDLRCKVASLNILKVISFNAKIRAIIVNLEGVQSLVNVLLDPLSQVKSTAAETLMNVFKNPKVCLKFIQLGGVKNLVSLLTLTCSGDGDRLFGIGGQKLEPNERLQVIRCGSMSLAVLSRRIRTRWFIHEAGFVEVVACLLDASVETSVLIPVLDALQQCSTESYFKQSVLEHGVISKLIHILKDKDQSDPILLTLCANILQKCSENPDARSAVRLNDGLKPLMTTVNKLVAAIGAGNANDDQRMLMTSMTGVIWKCSIGESENVAELLRLHAVDTFVKILESVQEEEVLCNAVGALSECVNSDVQREMIGRNRGVLARLVELLGRTNRQLLVNAVNALAKSCSNKENMRQIEDNDGIRLLWSLLKNDSPDVQASAASALHACVKQTSVGAFLI